MRALLVTVGLLLVIAPSLAEAGGGYRGTRNAAQKRQPKGARHLDGMPAGGQFAGVAWGDRKATTPVRGAGHSSPGGPASITIAPATRSRAGSVKVEIRELDISAIGRNATSRPITVMDIGGRPIQLVARLELSNVRGASADASLSFTLPRGRSVSPREIAAGLKRAVYLNPSGVFWKTSSVATGEPSLTLKRP
jgi:hypothetical protein